MEPEVGNKEHESIPNINNDESQLETNDQVNKESIAIEEVVTDPVASGSRLSLNEDSGYKSTMDTQKEVTKLLIPDPQVSQNVDSDDVGSSLSQSGHVNYDIVQDSFPTVSTQTDVLNSLPHYLPVEESNFLRFCHLIMTVAPQAVRHRFNQEFPTADLQGIIQRNKNTLLDLKIRRIITTSQWSLICPTGSAPVSSAFDVTLMLCLFRHLTKVSPKSGEYDVLPPPSDTSLGADLARIKYYRNNIAHYLEKDRKLDNNDFPIVWDNVSKVISRIGGQRYAQECSSLLASNLDSSYMDLYREILMNKVEIKQLENVQKTQQEETKNVENQYKEEIRNLKTKLKDPVPEHVRENIDIDLKEWESRHDKFIETRAATEVMKNIPLNNVVIVTGSPGSGKSFTVQHVLLSMTKKGCDVIPVTSASELVRYFKRSSKQIFYIDDLLGKYNVLKSDIEDWERNTKRLKDVFESSSTKCIFTCRLQIYQDSIFKSLHLEKCKVINLSGDHKLSYKEKINLCKQYLDQNVIESLYHDTIERSICFPLLCSLYNKHSNESFFEKPETFFKTELDEMKLRPNKIKYACIALCVMFNNNVSFKPGVNVEKNETIRGVFEELEVNITTPKKTIVSQFDSMIGSFFRRSKSGYQSIHGYLFDIFCSHVSETMMECFINYADSELIADRAVFQSVINRNAYIKGQSKDSIRKQGGINLLNENESSIDRVSSKSIEEERDETTYDSLQLLEIDANKGLKDQSMITIPKEFEECFFLRMMKDYNDCKVCEVFDSYQMMFGSYRLKLVSFFSNYNQNFNILDIEGQSATFVCSRNGYYDILETMCNAGGDVNLCTKRGQSPLCTSIRCARNLVQFGADVNKWDSNGHSPLRLAIYAELPDIVQLLCENGANVNERDSYGNALNTYIDPPLLVALLNEQTKCAEILLKFKADVNVYSLKGFSPLIKASYDGLINIVQILCDKGADVNKCDEIGQSPLLYALLDGHTKCAEILLEFEADVNICDSYGNSPLLTASSKGFSDIVQILCDKGADVNKCDENGCSPLLLAFTNTHTKWAEILLKFRAD